MFCPRCGQQMLPDARFCSKCGFVLGSVSQLLSTNGIPGATDNAYQPPEPSARDKGIRGGAKLLFLSAVLFPLAFGLCFLTNGPGPLLIPLTIALAGAALMLYARLFWPHHQFPKQGIAFMMPVPFVQNPVNQMLPPPSAVPVNNYSASRLNTADMMGRPSVVEHTTKLLEHEPE